MAKVNLLEVGGGYAAQSGLNANAGIIQDAFENTLSRNGSVPNEMQAVLDMNNFRVINVGLATNPRDAVPLEQMITLGSGFAGVASVGGSPGIVIDATNPAIPVVQLDAPVVDALNLAITSAQEDEEYLLFGVAPAELPNARQLVAGAGILINLANPGQAIISSAGLISHSSLLDLNADDHPQYPSIATPETITGDWTFNADVRLAANRKMVVGNTNFVANRAIEVQGNTGQLSSIMIGNWSNNPNGPELAFFKSHTNVVGVQQIVLDGDILGEIAAYGDSGVTHEQAAKIQFVVDGVPSGLGDMPGRMSFFTSPDGTSNPTERLRIGQNGAITQYNKAIGVANNFGWSDALGVAGISVTLQANGNNLRVDYPVGNVTTFGHVNFNTTGILHNMPAVYARVITWAGAFPLTITGIVPAAPGQVLVICNANTIPNSITLANEDAGSDPANRFALPNASNANIQRGGSARLWYNPTTSRWAAFGVS